MSPKQLVLQGLRMRSTSAIQAKLKAVAGYTARYGKWSVVGELQSGVCITGFSVETRLADCLKSSMTTHAKAVVEPRIGVQRWLSPWLTTDLAVGSDLMQERDVSLTLSLTAHSRSYDGLY